MLEWKKLGEVISVHTGSQLNRNDMLENGTFPVINGGKNPSGYILEPNEKGESITISQGGESAGFVNWMDCDFWAGAHCYVVDYLLNVNKRYLYHFLKNSEHELMSSKQGAGIPGLNRNNLYKLVVPVPSIAEQTRIVGILDTFTASIENLKQQIAQRRKQYEHYRDQLLDLEGKEGVEMKTLGEVSIITGDYGLSVPSKPFDGVRYLRITDITDSGGLNDDRVSADLKEDVKKEPLKDGDILFARTGATVGKTLVYKKVFGECLYAGYLIRYRLNVEKVLPQYMFHITHSNNYYNWVSLSLAVGAQPNISAQKYNSLLFPVPSLPEQQRIVSILDTFEASIANLEQQLAQRERQYEYYRNKLLTFE